MKSDATIGGVQIANVNDAQAFDSTITINTGNGLQYTSGSAGFTLNQATNETVTIDVKAYSAIEVDATNGVQLVGDNGTIALSNVYGKDSGGTLGFHPLSDFGNVVSGTGSSNRVAIWTGSTTQTSDSSVLFNISTNVLTVGTSGADSAIQIYKADDNVSDHIQFYVGSTRVGEIGGEDTTWLRINQETAKNIYTPRYIRADSGFYVDGTRGVKDVTGSYGNIQTVGDGVGNWEGYSIHGWVVLMADSSTGNFGIYDDVNNEWTLRGDYNGETQIYYNGSEKIKTTSVGVTVTGNGTATDWVATSDKRLKKNISYEDKWLDKVLAIGKKAARYDWINNRLGGENNIGFIAQDILMLMPEVVYEFDYNVKEEVLDGASVMKPAVTKKRYGITYDKMIAPLYSAFTEFYEMDKVWKRKRESRINQLEMKVKELENELNDLRNGKINN